MQATHSQAPIDPAAGLTLEGESGYVVNHNRVTINITKVANHRDPENLSGTLSIELWALKQPYGGGDFTGEALAGISIGEISGQRFLENCQYELDFREPPAGTWYLSLMLREWTEQGYMTRDFVSFVTAYTVNDEYEAIKQDTDSFVEAGFSDTDNRPPVSGADSVKIDEIESAVSASQVTTETSVRQTEGTDTVGMLSPEPSETLSVKDLSSSWLEKIRRFFGL